MDKETIIKELTFKAIRSSGAGGQHVNKVASKVEVKFNISESNGLNPAQKKRLLLTLGNRLTKTNSLVLQCDEARSQHRNKDLVVKRFFVLLKNALHVPKKRKTTQPSKASIEKRITSKKYLSQKKTNRKKPDY